MTASKSRSKAQSAKRPARAKASPSKASAKQGTTTPESTHTHSTKHAAPAHSSHSTNAKQQAAHDDLAGQGVDHREPQTLVGGAELAGAQMARNEVAPMAADAEGIPERDD